MNPFQHGEVFVTDDGGEIDLDVGHYERFLDVNLTRAHNITTGKVYKVVIEKERCGNYLGQTVQIVPHLTDEIKHQIREVAEKSNVDVVLVEIGGTVGDIESMPFLEAVRQMRLEDGPKNVAFVHVTLVPVLDVVGEQKTKPTQHSVKELRAIGIQPDVVICRAKEKLTRGAKAKISLFCNVEERAVVSAPDTDNIYKVPLILEKERVGDAILEKLTLTSQKRDLSDLENFVNKMDKARKEIEIAFVGKYTALADSYISILEALKHAGAEVGCRVRIKWVEAEQLEIDPKNIELLKTAQGILIGPGFGVRGTEGKILAAKYSREHNVPYLGICFGMQLAAVEIARNMLGLNGANSTELDPKTPHPVIDILPEQKQIKELGGTMRLGAYPAKIKRGTLAYELYKQELVYERHRHRFEVNPEYIKEFEKHNVIFSGTSPDDRLMEIIELPGHKFLMGSQFHPEFKSRPGKPAPLFYGFVRAAAS